MNQLLVTVAILALITLIVGGFVVSVRFLLWIGIVILILAVIAWALRMLTARRS